MGVHEAPTMARYRVLATDRPADGLERELLVRWSEDDLFRRIQRESAGRPFAVGGPSKKTNSG